MARAWPDTFVEEANLRVQILTIRRALGGPADAYVANVAPTARPRSASTPKLPVSTSTPNLSASSSMTWLERINFYRAALGLDPIRSNPDLSAAAAAHARYLLLNFGEDLRSAKPMSGDAYEEKPGNRGYSASGAAAARNLQLAWGCSSYDTAQQIDRWIEAQQPHLQAGLAVRSSSRL